jgi:hypothetical protein
MGFGRAQPEKPPITKKSGVQPEKLRITDSGALQAAGARK